MAQIIILGSGFGALNAIRNLRRLSVQDPITVISPRADLHYLPSSIWIPSGLRQAQNLVISLQHFFDKNNVTFVQASVTDLSNHGRLVHTDKGDFTNDILIIATGARFLRKLPGIDHALVPCEGLAVAETIAQKLAALRTGTIAFGFATNPNEPGAMRGGPMFEYLFIIDTLLRRQGRRKDIELVFFSPAPRPGARLGEKAVDGLLRTMHRRNIKTYLGHKLVRFEENKVVTESDEIPADLILFMPGLTGQNWFEAAQLPLSPGGMIRGDKYCQVEGMDQVWVVGDAGSYPGPDWLPKQAHQADLQAKAVATNITARLSGKDTLVEFKPELICIIDALNSGSLIYRTEKHNIVTPPSIIFHWMKRAFEAYYLRSFR